jgi:hypothetical protein
MFHGATKASAKNDFRLFGGTTILTSTNRQRHMIEPLSRQPSI